MLEPLLDPEAAIAGTHPPIHPDGNVLRHQRIGCGDPDATGDVVVEGTYEIGMQDQAFLGLEAARRRPRRRRPRRRAAHRHAVAARGPQADRRLPRAPRGRASGSCSAASAGRSAPARTSACRSTRACSRCGWAVRCAWPTAAPRASSATSTATRRRSGCATTPRRRRDRQDRGPLRARRRGLRVDVVGRAAQRASPIPGPVPLPERGRRRLGRAHQPPAVRGDARVRRRPGVLRPRGPDGPAGRGVRPRPGRGPPAQRDGHRRQPDHRPGRRERGAGRPLHPGDGGAADAGHADRRRPTATSTRCGCRVAPG